jgi:hypothetical protein
MQIPFAKSSYRRDRAFGPEQKLVNWIVEKDGSGSEIEPLMLLQRPGLERVATLPAPVQAMLYTAGGAAGTYAVAGSALYRIDDGATPLLGQMSGTDDLVSMASNFDRVAIVSSGLLYLYGASTGSTDNSFRQVEIPDGHVAADITSLNGYFVIACEDGRYYWLVPGDDDLSGDSALHFATAESSPDGLVGCAVLDGNLFLFGTTTTEVWQPVANADLPFQRITGQEYQRGCLSRDTIRPIDNSLIWVGDDGKVYRASNVPEHISTDSIDERIKRRSADPSAWIYSYESHLFYVLSIPGQSTFAYDISTQIWSEVASEGYANWRPIVGATTPSDILCGDSETGAVWKLTDAATDDGDIIRRTVSATVAVSGRPRRIDNIVLDVAGSAACTWMVRWADADELVDDQEWISLDARPGADVLTLYRMGAASQPCRTIEVEITDPVGARFSGGRIGEAYR